LFDRFTRAQSLTGVAPSLAEPSDIAARAVRITINTALTGATYDIDGGQQYVGGWRTEAVAPRTAKMTHSPPWQTALQQYEWIGILIARLSVGALFALSGGGKLFVPSRRDEMVRTLRAAGVPAPPVNAVLVSSVEFLFGSLLIVGFLTPLCCLMLSGVMVVALATTVLPRVEATSLASWLSSVLYLPEVLYVLILVWLLVSGPGWFSLDYLTWR
jgi:putative oxidoreductase